MFNVEDKVGMDRGALRTQEDTVSKVEEQEVSGYMMTDIEIGLPNSGNLKSIL